MRYHEIFASTCLSAKEIRKKDENCKALNKPFPYSVPLKIYAESSEEALKKYRITSEFNEFITAEHVEGTIHFFEFLDNGQYIPLV